MITNERLTVIAKELINHLDRSNGDGLYNILSNCIGMTDNEIDQLCGNFDDDREGFDDDVTIRYYVCALGYDANYCCTDYERDFGDFDTYEEAYHAFVTLQSANSAMFFENVNSNVAYIKLQLEECEETEEEINCIDVRNETDIERRS